MTLTDKQQQTYSELDSRGFHLNVGEPCECGGEHYRNRSKAGFSDSLIFYHHCERCGNDFSSWIEG